MRRNIVPALAFLILFLAVPPSALAADYDAGIQAYMNKDFAGAVRELLPLAAEGDARAQYAAGVLYQKGQGLTQDYSLAWYWYSKAEAQGHDKAAQARLKLEAEMTPEQLAQGQEILADESVGGGAQPEPAPEAAPTGTSEDLNLPDALLHPTPLDPAIRVDAMEAFAQSRGLALVHDDELTKTWPDGDELLVTHEDKPFTGAGFDPELAKPTYVEYRDGRKDGYTIVFEKDDAGGFQGRSVTAFEENVQRGPQVHYYPDGTPETLCTFESKDSWHGPYYKWYPDGAPQYMSAYVHDELDGEDVFFYPNGQTQSSSYFSMGARDGWSRTYFENGKVETEQQFAQGKCLSDRVVYDDQGEEINREPCTD